MASSPPLDEEVCIGLLHYSSDESVDEWAGNGAAGEDDGSDGGGSDSSEAHSAPLAPPEHDLPSPPDRLCDPTDPRYSVQRIPFSSLSVADFRRRVHDERVPLIITGLGPHIAPRGFDARTLRAALPDGLVLPIRGRGAMEASEFWTRYAAGERVYLADVPIARHAPWLYSLFRVPRYFLHCFSHRTRRPLSIAHDTPAIFISTASTASALHVDQMCSNFWMYLGEGRKHWVTFHPDDTRLLSPTWDDAEQIHRFLPIAELEADADKAAQLHRARRVEFTLCAGEVLYIPRGTPHEVTNLSATTAVSANFLDQSNVAETLAQGRAKLERRDPASARYANLAATLDALDEIDWPDLDADVADDERGVLAGEQMVGCFAAHERIKTSRPVTLRPPDPECCHDC